MNGAPTNRAEFIAAVILIVFSFVLIVNAYYMPPFSKGWYAAPGFPPAFFGIILLIMSIALLVRCLRRGKLNLRIRKEELALFVSSPVVRRLAFVILAMVLFIFLFGKIPFLLLSILFLLATSLYIKDTKIWHCILTAFLASAIIWYVFGVIFLVPLP